MSDWELREGRLYVGGSPVPLRRGAVYVPFLRAGWRGVEGPIPSTLASRVLETSRLIAALVGKLYSSVPSSSPGGAEASSLR